MILNNSQVKKQKFSFSLLRKDFLFSLILGGAVTITLLIFGWRSDKNEAFKNISYQSDLLKGEVISGINATDVVGRNLQALFHSIHQVDADMFRIYCEEILASYPFIKSVYYFPLVSAENQTEFEQAQRQWGLINFEIFAYDQYNTKISAPAKDFYFPLLYAEPFSPDQVSLIGYDISSDNGFETSIQQAIITGYPAKSLLIESDIEKMHYYLFNAIYEGKKRPEFEFERQNKVNGIVAVKIDPDQFFTDFLIFRNYELNIKLFSYFEVENQKQLIVDIKSPDLKINYLLPIISFGKTIPIIIDKQKFELLITKKIYLFQFKLWFTLLSLIIGLTFSFGLFIILKRRADLNKINNELKFAQNYMKNIFHSQPSMLISADLEGRITQWNSAAEKFTGIKYQQVINHKLWETVPFLKTYQNSYLEVIRTKRDRQFTESFFKNNKKYTFDIDISPLIFNGIIGAIIRIDDLTEMKKKEEQLTQAQKMETVGNLAGGLAHDFNNILGGITGIISVFKYRLKKYGQVKKEELEDYIQTMEDAGNRASDMVQQLLALSKKKEFNFTSVDLNLSIKNVIKLCQGSFDKSILIKSVCFPRPAYAYADSTQLEQVLLNLSINANHAMTIMRSKDENQGGELVIELLSSINADRFFCTDHPEAIENEEYWCLTVADNGVGMDSKTIAKIFDPFFTTKSKGKGSGLGLSMVYNIIQQHKGFIDVYSEVGLGSAITIYLPVQDQNQIKANGKQEKKIELNLEPGQGLILVVDDEEIMRNLAKSILEEYGYTVVTAVDGEDAIAVFNREQQRIKAVLLDMIMPKKSGMDTYLEMKKIQPDVKVLLASGFKKDQRVKSILDLGVLGFIKKPYTLERLIKAIQTVINYSPQ